MLKSTTVIVMIATHRETHTHTQPRETDKPIAIGEIFPMCLKISLTYCARYMLHSYDIRVRGHSLSRFCFASKPSWFVMSADHMDVIV